MFAGMAALWSIPSVIAKSDYEPASIRFTFFMISSSRCSWRTRL